MKLSNMSTMEVHSTHK